MNILSIKLILLSIFSLCFANKQNTVPLNIIEAISKIKSNSFNRSNLHSTLSENNPNELLKIIFTNLSEIKLPNVTHECIEQLSNFTKGLKNNESWAISGNFTSILF